LPSPYPSLTVYPATAAVAPPGMTREEAAVWDAFRRTNLAALTTVYYNVHVGTVPGDDPDETPADRIMRASLYAKRVDVIARTPRDTWVIELKTHARSSALGQLLVYVPQVAARFPEFPRLRPMLVSATADPDLDAVCATLRVECYRPPFTPITLTP